MKTAIEVTKEIVEEIYNKFEEGKMNQGEALTQIQSLASIFERCVNKHNVPGDGAQDKNLQKMAHKQFPYLDLLTLDLNPKVHNVKPHNKTVAKLKRALKTLKPEPSVKSLK